MKYLKRPPKDYEAVSVQNWKLESNGTLAAYPVPPQERIKRLRLAGAESLDQEVFLRSLNLLLAWLSPQQRREFEEGIGFTVVGPETGIVYYLTLSYYFGIWIIAYPDEYDKPAENPVVHSNEQRFCLIPDLPTVFTVGAYLSPYSLPTAMPDYMLAQKIMLETDEIRSLKTARHFNCGIISEVLGPDFICKYRMPSCINSGWILMPTIGTVSRDESVPLSFDQLHHGHD